ncbi:electron transport complex subunit RsxB, partial [Vibrio alginolyticus]|nr:electron transport complex subunit RsxB [Vibrio alginolyticus]
EMIPVETTTDSWKWQLNAIPVVNITDAASDAANVKDSIK